MSGRLAQTEGRFADGFEVELCAVDGQVRVLVIGQTVHRKQVVVLGLRELPRGLKARRGRAGRVALLRVQRLAPSQSAR